MTLTLNAKVEAVRPIRGIPNKKKSWAYHFPLSRYGPWKFCQPLAYKTTFASRILEPWLVEHGEDTYVYIPCCTLEHGQSLCVNQTKTY